MLSIKTISILDLIYSNSSEASIALQSKLDSNTINPLELLYLIIFEKIKKSSELFKIFAKCDSEVLFNSLEFSVGLTSRSLMSDCLIVFKIDSDIRMDVNEYLELIELYYPTQSNTGMAQILEKRNINVTKAETIAKDFLLDSTNSNILNLLSAKEKKIISQENINMIFAHINSKFFFLSESRNSISTEIPIFKKKQTNLKNIKNYLSELRTEQLLLEYPNAYNFIEHIYFKYHILSQYEHTNVLSEVYMNGIKKVDFYSFIFEDFALLLSQMFKHLFHLSPDPSFSSYIHEIDLKLISQLEELGL